MLGIYTRLSREDEDSNSIKNQSREGISFANRSNFKYKLFDEGEGVSGTLDIEDRPVLSDLISDVKKGVINKVWMRNQNRLDRNSLTFFIFVDAVKKNNVDVYFGDNDKLDFNDPATLLQSSILSSLNSYQAGLQSKATKKALKDNASEGKTHGISPYGYTKDANRYIIIEGAEAEIVKRIYKMSLEGIGTNKIAEIFNAEQIPTRYNKIGIGTITTKYNGRVTTTNKKDIKWAGNTIRGIIKNPIYKGERHLKSGVYKAPNIMTSHYWQKVNDNLEANRNNSGKVVTHKYLLKGIIRCAKCGKNYYGRTRVNKKDNYYMCSSKRYKHLNCGNRSFNIDVLEYFIWSAFMASGWFKKIAEEHFSKVLASDKVQDVEKELKGVESALKRLVIAKNNLIDAVSDGTLSNDDVKSKLAEIKRNEKDNLRLKKNLIEESESFNIDVKKWRDHFLIENLSKWQKISKEYVEKNEVDVYHINDKGDYLIPPPPIIYSFNEKREILEKYISNITISYEDNFKRYILDVKPNIIGMGAVSFLIPVHKNYAISPPNLQIEDLMNKQSLVPQAFFYLNKWRGKIFEDVKKYR